ncbi:hypothetical protein ACWCPC_41285, partial [Streptomyces decoyicus]
MSCPRTGRTHTATTTATPTATRRAGPRRAPRAPGSGRSRRLRLRTHPSRRRPTQHGGYLLQVQPGQVDVQEFEQLALSYAPRPD